MPLRRLLCSVIIMYDICILDIFGMASYEWILGQRTVSVSILVSAFFQIVLVRMSTNQDL
jgi:hypothetical protein